MSFITQTKRAAPSAPASGKASQCVDTAGRQHVLDATGVDNVLNARDLYNYVRNGGFWFAQRQAPATLTTYSSATVRQICADGWGIVNENASAQYRRVDTISAAVAGLRSRYYGELTKITSAGKLVFTQAIEGVTAANLRGQKVRVTAKLWGVVGTPALRLGLVQLAAAGTVDALPATYISALGANGVDPTLGTNLAYIAPTAGITGDNCTVNGNAADCTLTSAVQRFSAVFTVPADCKNLVVQIWSNAQVTATNGFALAEVSLTDGQETQDWSAQSYQEELDRVQRFYCKTFAVDTAPATNAGVTTGCLRSVLGKAGIVALAAQFHWRYPVRLRAAATTLTLYNPGAANAAIRQIGGTAGDLTASASANSTEMSVDVTGTGITAGAVGDQVGIHLTADAEL